MLHIALLTLTLTLTLSMKSFILLKMQLEGTNNLGWSEDGIYSYASPSTSTSCSPIGLDYRGSHHTKNGYWFQTMNLLNVH